MGGGCLKIWNYTSALIILNSKENSQRGNLGSSVKTPNFILLLSAVVYGEYEVENRVE